MAPALISTLGSWEADNVTVAQVEQAMSGLRRHQMRAAVRTGILTLVCVVSERAGADLALGTVNDLGPRHPARTLVIVVADDADGGVGMDATASVQAVEVAGRAVCYEEIVLRVRGPGRHHLDSIIRPLCLPDLPVTVWTPVQLPALGDPMLAVGDRMLVDTRAAAHQRQALTQVAKLMRQLEVTDLSWVRLGPWRNQLAGLFQGQVNRPFLADVSHVEVAGRFAARHLLAGWIMRRLNLPHEAVSMEEAPHVSIRITARSDGKGGEFAVYRPADERALVATVEIEDGPSATQTLPMPDRWAARALAEAITGTGANDSYHQALAGAISLLS